MRRHELREIAARLSGLALIVSFACTDDETGPPPDDASFASTGANSSAAATASTGTGGNAGGSTSGASGANSGTGGAGSSGSATGGSAGAAPDGAAGTADASAGDDGGAQAPLTICLRLTATLALSFDVTLAFERGMFTDCRMKWVTRLYLDIDERAEFLNAVNSWNLDFWGCTGKKTIADCPLLHRPARVSRDEAGLIVQRYIEAANTSLRMSPDEIQLMRAALEALVEPSVDASTEGFPRALCTDGSAGTDGGADGGPPAESGVDGEPGSDAETFDATEWDAGEEEGAPAEEDASPEESGP